MRNLVLLIVFLFAFFTVRAAAQQQFEEDTFQTSQGQLKITFIGHATLMFNFAGKIIHVDPVGRYADYTKMPKAD
ncbi:MAG: MBL fold metallo-hydrolase, partial [Candidatus Aminicenantales bacterium]